MTVNEISKGGKLTNEEGYLLVVKYTQYYWRINKFYSLKNKYELNDMIHHIYCHFLEKRFFEKYDEKVTSKAYFVMRGVMTRLVDEMRKYREHLSIEQEDENGITLGEKIPDDFNMEDIAIRNEIMDKIPGETDSKLVGKSPEFGIVNFSLKTVAMHLEKGYTVQDIAAMFMNPASGRHVSESRVSQLVKELRGYCKENLKEYLEILG